jgi:hypothetical protein
MEKLPILEIPSCPGQRQLTLLNPLQCQEFVLIVRTIPFTTSKNSLWLELKLVPYSSNTQEIRYYITCHIFIYLLLSSSHLNSFPSSSFSFFFFFFFISPLILHCVLLLPLFSFLPCLLFGLHSFSLHFQQSFRMYWKCIDEIFPYHSAVQCHTTRLTVIQLKFRGV